MKRKLRRFTFLAFPLVAAVVASGQTAWYPVYEKDNPTPVDLVLWDEEPHAVIVQIVNLTPYEIKFNATPQAYTIPSGPQVAHLKDVVDLNRSVNKSFMFAPVGVPNTMPGLPIGAFADLCKAPLCTPLPENSLNGHPYSMVLSWDDYNGMVNFSSVFWTIKQVPYTDINGNHVGDVPLGVYMSRISPPPLPVLGIIKAVIGVVKIAINTVKLALGDPFAAFELVKEFGTTEMEAITIANQTKKDGDGVKMYVSAFPPPQQTGSSLGCYDNPQDNRCYPSSQSQAGADDATNAQWGSGIGGPANSQVVVTTHVLRGTSPTYGTLPIVMITVMRPVDYWEAQLEYNADSLTGTALGPGGLQVQLDPEVRAIFDQLRQVLKKHGLAGSDALKVAIAALTPDQRETLRAILLSFWSGEELTRPEINKQRQFLHSLVVNLRLLLNENEEG